MKEVDIDILCYLEGLKVHVMSAVVTSSDHNLAVATVVLPQVDKVGEIMDGTTIQVFYYDGLSRVYRIMFDGVTTGVTYYRQGGKKNRSIMAVGTNKYLNDIPAQYLAALDLEDLYNLCGSYKFYGIDTKTAIDSMISKKIKETFGIFNEEGQEKVGVIDYFRKIMSLLTNSWEEYYKNINKRFMINKDHVYIDEDIYKEFFRAKGLADYLERANQEVIFGSETTLDGVLRHLATVGYSYQSISCPAYNEKAIVKNKSGHKIETSKESLAKHILIPQMLNVLPPRCNVYIADDVATLNANISSTPVTRLRQVYKILDVDTMTREYPHNLKSRNYALGEDEYELGIRGKIQTRSRLLHDIIGMDVIDSKKKNEEEGNPVWQNLTDFDFEKMRYQRNILRVSIPEFLPYGVVGFPAIVYDVPQKTMYYGTLRSISFAVDQASGQTTTQIEVSNVREIEDISNIGEINPFLDKGVFADSDNLEEYCYAPILKGSVDVMENTNDNMYPKVTRVEIGDDGVMYPKRVYPPEAILLKKRKKEKFYGSDASTDVSDIKTGYVNMFSKDAYCRREITTFGEYLYSRGLATRGSTPKDIYENKYRDIISDMARGKEEHIATLEEHGTTVLSGKVRFVKERRDKVKELIEAYAHKII